MVGLLSGGKDSTWNLCRCVEAGHEVVGVGNLFSSVRGEETDSLMFQTVGQEALTCMAQAMRVPLFRRQITGTAVSQQLDYEQDADDEVEDLFHLLRQMRDSGLQFDAVSVGAIASHYQRIRVQHVCNRLNVQMLAYLWHEDQTLLLDQMLAAGIDAVIVKTAVIGLNRTHIGQHLAHLYPHLMRLNAQFGINVCGEGGEYETLTLDSPLHHSRLRIDEYDVVCHSNDAFAPVYYMVPKKITLVPKSQVVES